MVELETYTPSGMAMYGSYDNACVYTTVYMSSYTPHASLGNWTALDKWRSFR